MASQFGDPPAPQSDLQTVKGTNQADRVGTYKDPALTLRNVDESPAPALDVPPPSGSRTLGSIRPFYANDQNEERDNVAAATENIGVAPPPHAPNHWQMQTRSGRRYRRDPYANNGQDPYLQNQA